MRPIVHPTPDEITVEGILYALSDPVRARIYAQLAEAACARNCAAFLDIAPGGKPLAKSTLSMQMRILREAGLIRSERQGVEVKNTPRCAELKEKFGPMIEEIMKAYQKSEGKKRGRR